MQDKVALLFNEMGYDAKTTRKIKLSNTETKEIDVFVFDPRASINQNILVECKLWRRRVNQEIVHAFLHVMNKAGANTGFIISKAGFQKGAKAAAKGTNINLMTWDQFQDTFKNEWYNYNVSLCERIISDIRLIDGMYLGEDESLCTFNRTLFEAAGKFSDMLDVLYEMRMLMVAFHCRPKTIDAPLPIKVQVPDGYPRSIKDKFGISELHFDAFRPYFRWICDTSTKKLAYFQRLRDSAHDIVNSLPDGGNDYYQQALNRIAEEAPIRLFKDEIGIDLYQRIITNYNEKQK